MRDKHIDAGGWSIAAALALAACAGEPAADRQAMSAATAQTPLIKADPGPAALTAQGWGPLCIGMTLAEVERALGKDANPEAAGGAEPEQCDQFRPARAPAGLIVMIQQGRLTRLSLVDGSPLRTDRGLGPRSTAAAVRRVYGPAISADSHKYVDAPAEYLTWWAGGKSEGPAARGIRYEIGADGHVSSVHAGDPSILYVEGCA